MLGDTSLLPLPCKDCEREDLTGYFNRRDLHGQLGEWRFPWQPKAEYIRHQVSREKSEHLIVLGARESRAHENGTQSVFKGKGDAGPSRSARRYGDVKESSFRTRKLCL